jgi:hypothetical protein
MVDRLTGVQRHLSGFAGVSFAELTPETAVY